MTTILDFVHNIPDGVYPGLLSGHELKFRVWNEEFIGVFLDGIRGVNFRTTITIKNGAGICECLSTPASYIKRMR